LQRLKAKLGNRSNASSEVEFHGAWARRIGEEGRGVATIIEMVHHTRLDCVIGAAGVMRRALMEAVHHARHRQAFGRKLIDQPLMQNVLADLAIETEAATVLMMRIARAFDQGDRLFARLAVAAGKYWVSKRTAPMVAEALECLGGNGFVEESAMPRLYREAPLNSIWEGSGNVRRWSGWWKKSGWRTILGLNGFWVSSAATWWTQRRGDLRSGLRSHFRRRCWCALVLRRLRTDF
jgi:putative acyl-CoA dehydrogenase